MDLASSFYPITSWLDKDLRCKLPQITATVVLGLDASGAGPASLNPQVAVEGYVAINVAAEVTRIHSSNP